MAEIEIKDQWQAEYIHECVTEDINGTEEEWEDMVTAYGDARIRMEYDNLIHLAIETSRILEIDYEVPTHYPDGELRGGMEIAGE